MFYPIKHSVLIITYNQEDKIAKAINSLLVQKEHIYEIVINDDCSTDKTWNIILEFQKQLPQLIKPHRNLQNIGIFLNEVNGLKSLTGDTASVLAGDDHCMPGLFKEMNNLIFTNKFDLEKDNFILFFNHEILYPNGKKIIINNSLCNSNNLFKLKLRGLIGNRTIGISKSIIMKINEIPSGLGTYSDMLLDIQFAYYANKAAYSPVIATTYNAGKGISSRTKYFDRYKSLILNIETLKQIYNNDLEEDDCRYLSVMIMVYKYYISPSSSKFIKTIFLIMKNRDCFLSSSLYKENLKSCLFVWIKLFIKK